ncbi:hypothetical protein Fcan01_11899 [Folsomia candida]|uniref:Uncharacterized protein n=1 Tax=Folsomia candida TaxID=158441 RepID=A0A226E8T7_FOLCA|nr:hypothetical protein Fcan01_11899 [Folsomia candida]
MVHLALRMQHYDWFTHNLNHHPAKKTPSMEERFITVVVVAVVVVESRVKASPRYIQDRSYMPRTMNKSVVLSMKPSPESLSTRDHENMRRRYNQCQHKHHVGQRARHQKNLHFITAEEHYSTHKHLGLLPNDAICNSKECTLPNTLNSVSSEEDEPPPAKKKKALEDLNRIRQILDPTAEPLSFGKRNAAGQSVLIKSSMAQVQDSIIKTFEEEGLKILVPDEQERIQQLERDSESFHWIMNELKIRLEGCSRAEAKSLLTIAPPNWSVYNTSAFFSRSEHLVRSSRKRREEAGCILPPIKPKNGRKLSESAKLAVQEFYYRDDVSQPGPGLRDVLSIFNPSKKKREKKQKRYLRSNLKELYQLFKMDHPQEKIGMT